MADLRIQYMEEMVGAGHPAKTDTLNRLMLSEHGINGAHKLFDVTHPDFGATGDGVTDDTAAIQAALDAVTVSGGIRTVYFPSGTYLISTALNFNKHNVIYKGDGSSSIIKTKNGAVNFTAQFLFATGLSYITIRDLVIDGNSDNNTLNDTAGIYALNTDHFTLQDCIIQNTPQIGLFLSATTLAHTNFKIIHNELRNIGYRAIQVHKGREGDISHNTVISSGNHGIGVTLGSTAVSDFSAHVTVDSNYVNRAVSPTTQWHGTVEGGFMILASEGSQDVVINNNRCFDNRPSGGDGIGTVGSPAGSNVLYRGIVISNNTVMYAGGFGIDASSHNTVIGNTVMYSGSDGIVIAGDLGPIRKDILIADNIVYNPNLLNLPGTAGIALNSAVNNGATWTHIKIANNIVLDEGPRADYGVLINSTRMSIVGMEIHGNDLEKVKTESIHIITPTNVVNLRVKDNVEKNLFKQFAPNDLTPSVLGGEFFITANSGSIRTITMFDNGYVGQRIHVRIGDNFTRIDFSATNLKGNGGVDYTAKKGSTLDCVFDGTQWGCTVNKA